MQCEFNPPYYTSQTTLIISERDVEEYNKEKNNTFVDDTETLLEIPAEKWQTHPIRVFTDKLSCKIVDISNVSKPLRSYYIDQDEQINSLVEVYVNNIKMNKNSTQTVSPKVLVDRKRTSILAKLSFVVNFIILIVKSIAVGLSGSLVIISTLLDSIVDLASGIVIWWTGKAMVNRNRYIYPQGRSRLEPVSIIVLAVIMGSTSVQIVKEAGVSIVNMATKGVGASMVDNFTIGLTSSVVVLKLILWIVCVKFGTTTSVKALALDHRNDVFSNAIALVCSTVSSRVTTVSGLKYLDPIGAIVISFYIFYSWWQTGVEHVKTLTGYTATPELIRKLIFLTLNHHPLIEGVDTVRAFHLGLNFFAEVDIILDAQTSLQEAHDIGESLQKKLEYLDEVERAFVHLDYESEHDPNKEHKEV